MANFQKEKFINHDDYMTPKGAWENIKHIIPKNKIIWEAFYGDGSSGNFLKELGFNVIHEPVDFFENDLGDIIVSNPPFSKYKEIMVRLKKLDKPFIIILPVSKITTKTFKENFNDPKLQIVIPPKRIQFTKFIDGKKDKSKRAANFDCFYYCYKLGLSDSITHL